MDSWIVQAEKLHDAVHEKAALVDMEGRVVGWAPEDSVVLLAAALQEAYNRGRTDGYQLAVQGEFKFGRMGL